MKRKAKRRILVLTSVWNIEYISKLIQGAQRRVGENTTDFYIFNGYDIVGNRRREKKECEIYRLPDPQDYDGILVVISSADSIPLVEELIKPYNELGKKFICVEMEFENACYVGVDNYRATYRIVEHLIKEHGCKVLNYVGGPKNHRENVARFQAFQDCLKAYGLQAEENRVAFLRFEYEDGLKAYELFKQNNTHLPDAVVCANDDMAMGYCEASSEDGFYAPEDYKITGFDNYVEAQHAFPSITSVNRNWDQLGYICMDALLRMMNGEVCPKKIYTDEILIYNESCGCEVKPRNIRKEFGDHFRKRQLEERQRERQRQVRQLLCGSLNEQEMCLNLIECCKMFDIEGIAVYLNHSFVQNPGQSAKEGYDDIMTLLNDGKTQIADRHKMSVPEQWLDGEVSRIFIFAPLHFLDQTFGYCVMPYQEQMLLNDNHRNLMESISLALENIHQRLGLNEMNQKLQELYIHDFLTGIYNRFGYGEKANLFFEKNSGRVYVVYMDIDDLKMINDTYGHRMGDKVIHASAEAMKSVFDEADDILVRMGGDEFLVIGKFEGEKSVLEKEAKIDVLLEKYTQESALPFELRVSMGHVWNEGNISSIEELVQLADHVMYGKKQQRKNNCNCDCHND